MFFILEPADAMSGLPRMHQHFGVLRFITDRASKSAVILVRMCQHNATDVGDANTRFRSPSWRASFASLVFGPVSMSVMGSSAIK